MQPHVYEWAKKRGFFGRKKAPVSHLLLDGGVLCVPQESSAEFVAAYAIGVVKKGRLPCVVETRTPTFRMFYDLDICMNPAMAAAFVRGDVPDAARAALELIVDVTRGCFDVDTAVVACASDAAKHVPGGGVKLGVHLTFDDVFVTSSTAMTVRDRVLDELSRIDNPFDNEWPAIVDSAVFKGSGMRLPWSTKKNETRTYVPIAEYAAGAWTFLNSRDVASSVAAARDLVTRVSLRSFRQPTPCEIAIDDDDGDPAATSFGMSHASLREYSGVVARLRPSIPAAYDGHVTAVLRGDHAIIFRHSSRYCANVGRRHNSSNTYFLLTRRGLQQCCYSRKDDDVAGRPCSCRDFRGEHLEVPKDLTDELFPPEPKPENVPPPMPSSRTTVNVDTIACSSRPAIKLAAPRAKKARVRPLSILLGR